jgi:thiol-disulfide isomerase/thioredoxin
MTRLFRSPVALSAAALVIVAIAAAALLYGKGSSAVHAKPPELSVLVPDKAAVAVPAVAFTDASGARQELTAYRGRYVLLNLWATWCGPCVKELPALAKLQAALPLGKLIVLTVNVGHGTASDTASFLKAHGAASLPVLVDSNSSFIRNFGAYGLPLSVLIDPRGREIARAEGPAEWDAPNAIAYFRALTHAS